MKWVEYSYLRATFRAASSARKFGLIRHQGPFIHDSGPVAVQGKASHPLGDTYSRAHLPKQRVSSVSGLPQIRRG